MYSDETARIKWYRSRKSVFSFLLSRIETTYQDSLCDFLDNILSLCREYNKINSQLCELQQQITANFESNPQNPTIQTLEQHENTPF